MALKRYLGSKILRGIGHSFHYRTSLPLFRRRIATRRVVRRRIAVDNPNLIASKRLLVARSAKRYPSRLNEIEDNRIWRPNKNTFYGLTINSEPVRMEVYKAKRLKGIAGRDWHTQLGKRLGFKVASMVIECIRRKKRRQVMFANKKAGGPVKNFKPPVRDWKSEIIC